MPHQVLILLAAGGLMFLVIGCLAALSHYYTLSGIKSKTVGDGQHGTARWATAKEIRQTYAHVPFEVKKWRSGQNLPTEQGLVLGCKGKKGELTALVDSDDIHCLMIGASGIGKTVLFSLSQSGVRLRQRHELAGAGQQGRPRPQLRRHCQELLWVSECGRDRPAKSHPLRR